SVPEPRTQARAGTEPLLRARGVQVSFDRPAVLDATFVVSVGRTLGVVGESGSGKTTLARVLVGVQRPDAGMLTWSSPQRVQLVHQNPLGAFDPRWTVARSLAEALQAAGVRRGERSRRVTALLAEVGLDPSLARRRPHE